MTVRKVAVRDEVLSDGICWVGGGKFLLKESEPPKLTLGARCLAVQLLSLTLILVYWGKRIGSALMVVPVVQADAAAVPTAPADAVVERLSDSDGPRKLPSWRFSPSRCEAAIRA